MIGINLGIFQLVQAAGGGGGISVNNQIKEQDISVTSTEGTTNITLDSAVSAVGNCIVLVTNLTDGTNSTGVISMYGKLTDTSTVQIVHRANGSYTSKALVQVADFGS